MNQENIPEINQSHALQKPLMLIAAAIMFAGILVAGSIVATKLFPKPPVPDKVDTVQKDDTPALSLGDDPVLGDTAKAKLAIVEFSDYECPFCQKFHAETLDALVKEYVDTGKAIMVFKDFPLSFHEPMASKEASAANCVQKLSGDQAYFAYSAALYKNTGMNGTGMSDVKMTDLASALGLSREAFTTCVSTQDFKDEIAQDQVEGEQASVTGTPAFLIGTLNADGTVTDGVKLVGAQPLSAFEKVIDKQLKK